MLAYVLSVTLSLFARLDGAIGSPGSIGPQTRILMIGDSQVVGPYGAEIHRLLSDTGAAVEQVGVAGASPGWFMQGTVGRSGWIERHADGRVTRPDDWRAPHATPRLDELVRHHRPDLVVISLGGNMRGYNEAWITSQTRALLAVAASSGAQVVWVSSPERRADDADPRAYQAFTRALREAVGDDAQFVDSSRHSDYAGHDGVHYAGTLGTERAQAWARGVFGEIRDARTSM